VAVPCRADEPSLGVVFGEILAQCEPSSLPMPRSLELLFCINGVGAPAGITPLDDLRQLCAQHGIPLTEEWVTAAPHRSLAAEPIGRVPHSADAARSGAAARMTSARAILTATEGKAHAWNLLRRACSGDPVIVCDADVTFSPGAFRRLYDGLLASPTLALFSPKTDCRHDGSLLERILAVPYRLDFPNLSGQLYAMRPERAPDFMPEDLLEPERWLELEVGPEHVGRDPGARVYVRLTATMRDFFRQRIRIEMGKVQLHDAYSHLLGRSRPQPGGAAVRTLALAERGALGAYLVLRSLAHARAWWRYHHGRRAGIWAQPATTKYWPDGVLRTGSRSLSAYSGPSSVGGGGPAARRDSAGNAPGIVEEVATPQTGRLRPRGDGSAYSDRLLGHRRTERHRLSSRPGGEATPMRILFLTPRFPYPALRGDQVRAYHQIRLLGRQHAVTLLALSERRVEPDAEAHVRGMCEALHIEPLSWGRQLSGLGRILVGDPRPVQTLLY